MNVFHKVLVKIYEISGGRDTVDVDLVDLLKKEGFFPSIDSISAQLLDEGWIIEGGRKHVVKITHWGSTEAKRVLSNSPDRANEVEKNTNKMLAEGRELLILIEDFSGKMEPGKIDLIDKKAADIRSRVAAIRQHL